MPFSDKEKLLHDILHEGDYEQFRADVLRASAHEFRRYHRKKSLQFWFAAAACVVAMIVGTAVVFRKFSPPGTTRQAGAVQPSAPQADKPEPEPFKQFETITTQPIPPALVVRSVPSRSFIVETASQRPQPGLFVYSSPTPLPQIADTELLALFADRPAGFIQTGDQRKFVILGPPRFSLRPRESIQ